MNLVLFEQGELNGAVAILAPRDPRALHLRKVLRKGPGDDFDAGVLGGKLGRGRIDGVGEDGSLTLSLLLDRDAPARQPLRIAVGFPRPIQLRRLLRDLSSLGVGAIDLVGTELGEKSYRDTKLLVDGGARDALMEGAVQARDASLPELGVYSSLKRYLSVAPWLAAGEPIALLAPDNVRPQASFASLEAMAGDSGGELVLALGSERGWSDAERLALEAAGFRRVSMGERALRTETAAVAAVVLALEKIGALG